MAKKKAKKKPKAKKRKMGYETPAQEKAESRAALKRK